MDKTALTKSVIIFIIRNKENKTDSMSDMKNTYKILMENFKETDILQDLCGWIILQWKLQR